MKFAVEIAALGGAAMPMLRPVSGGFIADDAAAAHEYVALFACGQHHFAPADAAAHGFIVLAAVARALRLLLETSGRAICRGWLP